MDIEFSLRGLSGLLEKNGLRVVAGKEVNGSFIEREGISTRLVYRVEKIDLTVTLERPVPETSSSPGHPPTCQEEG
jgi:hypothetical protein